MTFFRHGSPAAPLIAVSVLLTLSAGSVYAQAPMTTPGASPALPVRSVTLFSSGVSYTLREGEVNGNATIPITFRTTQINDILKSLVLLDEHGTVQPAVYGAKDPIGRALQSFAVDVTEPTSQADLLNRLRGACVAVETNAKETLQGQIVGVESRPLLRNSGDGNEKSISVDILTILGDAGLQSMRLDEVRAVRLLDERLNREFREALSLLSAGSDDKRRQVTLRFDGQGHRHVRVGYVSEAPLWKISYRLLMGGMDGGGTAAGAKPYLQGWALVENTTDEDWNSVSLALVSGRPVSFIQDLYQPLYLPRPIVPPDVVASPFPQLAEANIETNKDEKGTALDAAAAATTAPARGARKTMEINGPAAAPGITGIANGEVGGTGNVERFRAGARGGFGGARSFDEAEALHGSVAAQASGQKAGELFQYNITTPVTLPRQQAAMIPVIAQDVAGDKVSIYNADTDARFPLNAFRLRNNTTLHLKGGPVTLFDGGVYAGDARMEDIPPGDMRLITYAVDLAVDGERQGPQYSGVQTSLIIRRGVLVITRRERMETNYTLKNKADQPRTVLVEHPFSPEYILIEPTRYSMRTASHFRFELPVPAGKTGKLKVVTERPVSQSVALLNEDLNTLEVYAKGSGVPESVRAALRETQQRRRRIQDLQSRAAAAENEVASIDKDQDRIRKNMTSLDKSAPLYKRYVTQLDQQETRIQALRTEANSLRSQAAAADRDLRAYLDTLDINP